MTNIISTFESNDYVILSGALSKEECDGLTKHLFNLYSQGQTEKDPQCPLSDSVYGDPAFDELLQKMAIPLGNKIDKKLLPTYTYARIYRPGETLKRHKDRPACEISATLTLGYDGNSVWPIMFDDEKEIMAELEVGELALYKGCDITHWRTPFKGNWQTQVFLHYVDADGPYADQRFDGRNTLGTEKTVAPKRNSITSFFDRKNKKHTLVNDTPKPKEAVSTLTRHFIFPKTSTTSFPGYFPIDKNNHPELMSSKQECERIIGLHKDLYATNASVGTSKDRSITKEIRAADVYNIENNDENKWIFEKIANVASFANDTHFQYEVYGIRHGIQLIHYRSDTDVKGHYNWHIDCGPGEAATRKISFTMQLSDPNTYKGCDLVVNDHQREEVIASKAQGAISLFPSYMPHFVAPIERGERFALVVWIHGSRRFS